MISTHSELHIMEPLGNVRSCVPITEFFPKHRTRTTYAQLK